MPSALPEDVHAQLVADVVAGGQGIRETARKHGVAMSTVSKAVHDYHAWQGLESPKQRRLMDRVVVLSGLTMDMLETLAKVMTDASYVREQPIGDVAKAFGIGNDKVMRWAEYARTYDEPVPTYDVESPFESDPPAFSDSED